ncbi:MAG: Hpt domain-containing protein, partial [Pseudomonadales bacterium]|nr:Hpt domain-containing protein [Pseudomonadales bacterium]
MALPAPANYDPNLLDDFMVEFEEAHEFSENILVELEKHPADEELLHKLFRSVHTIKGNLTFIGFQILVPLLQSVEDILSAVRNEEFSFTREISDVVLLSLDRTKELIAELSGGDDSGTTESSLDHL